MKEIKAKTLLIGLTMCGLMICLVALMRGRRTTPEVVRNTQASQGESSNHLSSSSSLDGTQVTREQEQSSTGDSREDEILRFKQGKHYPALQRYILLHVGLRYSSLLKQLNLPRQQEDAVLETLGKLAVRSR